MASKTIGELHAIAGDFKPLPVAEYPVEVTGADFVSKADKNPYFKIEFTITEGPHIRRKLWSNLVLGDSEGSAGYFFSKMKTLGLGEDYWQAHESQGLDEVAPEVCAFLIGRPARVTTKLSEYPKGSGTLKTDVDKILAVGGTVATPGVPQIPATTVPSVQSFTAPVLPAGL